MVEPARNSVALSVEIIVDSKNKTSQRTKWQSSPLMVGRSLTGARVEVFSARQRSCGRRVATAATLRVSGLLLWLNLRAWSTSLVITRAGILSLCEAGHFAICMSILSEEVRSASSRWRDLSADPQFMNFSRCGSAALKSYGRDQDERSSAKSICTHLRTSNSTDDLARDVELVQLVGETKNLAPRFVVVDTSKSQTDTRGHHSLDAAFRQAVRDGGYGGQESCSGPASSVRPLMEPLLTTSRHP